MREDTMTSNQGLLQADNVLIIAIDNPHLCLGRRLCRMVERLVQMLPAERITVCGNYPSDLKTDGDRVTLIPIVHGGPVPDEQAFRESFQRFEDVDLLRQIRMPVSGLDLFDATGYDGLIYPYRVSCELDWSGLQKLRGPYDLVMIAGGSHFNYPLPERVLATARPSDRAASIPLIGVPLGPVTGPLSPHWCGSCDTLLLPGQRILHELRKTNESVNGQVQPDLFDGIAEPVSQRFSESGRPSVLLDWTFLHNWQLKTILGELAANGLAERIELHLTAVSEETTAMLWAKWGTMLEDLDPRWVTVNTDRYYQAAGGADAVVTFVGGRDTWVWRQDGKPTIACDLAGWWRAFGFEGPDPVASPRRIVSQLARIASSVEGKV